MKIEKNVPLASYTYYKIGGAAQYFALPQSIEDLNECTRFLNDNPMPFFILGAGSNLLISDKGFSGFVIRVSKLNTKLELNSDRLTVGTSVLVIQLLRKCMNEGLDGLKMLVGIPGSMGGLISMNAGTKSGEIKDILEEVITYNLLTGKTKQWSTSELKFKYRKNLFLNSEDIIYESILRINPNHDPKRIQAEITTLLENRKKSQPIEKPSCGSVFKNPDPENGIHAWKLISDAGLRGYQIGGAQISQQHCNFIINLGNAKSTDVRSLIEEAKKRVFNQFGIMLEEEVQYVGF